MKELLEKYARLAVKVGVNLQPGQYLVITSTLEYPEFTRMVAKAAYEAGASKVEIEWNDAESHRLDYLYNSDEELANVPEWKIKQKEEQINRKCAMINIGSQKPSLLSDIDSKKIKIEQMAFSKAFQPFRYYKSTSQGQWLGLCVPNADWAALVFPNLDVDEAVCKLWEAIFQCCRINKNDDPIALWQKHVETILSHRQLLTDYAFESLHFKNGLGTDLTVGLVDDHQWSGGQEMTPANIGFTPNMPTEEVFCMPHRLKVNGKVVATKPLNIQGKLCEDFYFIFKDGKVIEAGAKKNQEALENLLDMDEGARYLGEVALISDHSPISDTDLIFYNTLFDENASCHLALGNCYGSNMKNAANMTKEEMEAAGANFSMIHCDFMFGSPDMEVVGTCADGKQIQLFKEGNFII